MTKCDHANYWFAIFLCAVLAALFLAAFISMANSRDALGNAICTSAGKGALVAIDGDTLTCQPPASEARPFAGLIIKEGDP